MRVIALVDCNNFYVSCERLFNPKIRNKPVVVLSNNDGCIIARSEEAKDLGIKMGEPLHLCQNLIRSNKVEVYSSNYTLYGDISNRIMHFLKSYTEKIEIYSVDEAFLDLTHIPRVEQSSFIQKIKKEIYQNFGIPVSVGLAPNKVLAKISSKKAKKSDGTFNYFNLDSQEIAHSLSQINVQEIWGIGSQCSKKLNSIGVYTAQDLKLADIGLIKKMLGVVGSRIQYELKGLYCIEIEDCIKGKKQIISSKSFGGTVTQLSDLEQAVSNFVTTACSKLRAQNSYARSLSVFIQTNRFSEERQYFNSNSAIFNTGQNSTSIFIAAAKKLLKTIFLPGFKYKKAGVSLSMIEQHQNSQDVLLESLEFKSDPKLVKIIDNINSVYGKNTLLYAACGKVEKQRFIARAQKKSQKFTSSWQEILTVKI